MHVRLAGISSFGAIAILLAMRAALPLVALVGLGALLSL
jgi:hypothetical protein